MAADSDSKYEELLQPMQRDFNCLIDANRATRSDALNRLRRKLLPIDSKLNIWSFLKDMTLEQRRIHAVPILDRVFRDHLSSLLLKLFEDPIESCRTSSLELFMNICKELPSCSEYLSACASVAARRIGSSQQHQLEPTEELRLALINTLNHLLDQAVRDRNDSVIAHSMDDLVTAASKAVADAFPDLKKEASNLIQLLASACDEFAESEALSGCSLETYFSTMASAVLPNLGHQRNPVRQAALQSIASLMIVDRRYSSGGLRSWSEQLLPSLMQVTNDRTPSVRHELVKASSQLLQQLPNISGSHRARLLLLLLSGVADSTTSISEHATQSLEGLGRTHTVNSSDDATLSSSSSSGASALVSSVLPDLVVMLLSDLSDWTSVRRYRGAALLATAIKYSSTPSSSPSASSPLVSHLPHILPALARCVHDDDKSVSLQVLKCCKLLGTCIAPQTLLAYLYAAIGVAPEPVSLSASSPSQFSQSWVSSQATASSSSSASSMVSSSTSSFSSSSSASDNNKSPSLVGVHQLANSLAVLSGILAGWASVSNDQLQNSQQAAGIVEELTRHLFHSELCCHDNAAVRQHVLAVVNCVVQLSSFEALLSSPSSSSSLSIELNVFWSLLQLDAMADDADFSQLVFSSIESLAAKCRHSSINELYSRHFVKCLGFIHQTSFHALPDNHYVAPLPNYYEFVGPNTNLEQDASPAADITANISSPCSSWKATSPQRLLFSALCRRGVQVIDMFLHECVPVIASCAHPDADAAVRVSSLSLAEFIIRNGISASSKSNADEDDDDESAVNSPESLACSNQRWSNWLDLITKDAIIPNIRWKAGRVASSIRLQAFLALNALFERGLFTVENLNNQTFLPDLLPVVTTSLDDFDPRIRLQACHSMKYILLITNAVLDEMVLTNLYRELLKRLDDSSDEIRVDACETFTAYRRIVPTDYDRQHFKYLMRGLLVHLDDTNPSIQEAVFQLLLVWQDFDPVIFFSEIHAVRDKHSSAVYCDKLLALAPKL